MMQVGLEDRKVSDFDCVTSELEMVNAVRREKLMRTKQQRMRTIPTSDL